MDIIDAYNLRIDETYLFSDFEEFIAKMGIPTKVSVAKTEYEINSRVGLDSAILSAKPTEIVQLYYLGIEMLFSYDNYIIPSTIDFRTSGKSITYGSTLFNTDYTTQQFKKQFPISGNPKFKLPQSFFEITTKEKGSDFEHFMLLRKSKDDPEAILMIEFTFYKEKLIFIVFSNYS